ncbi:MAG: 5-oxoprolinase subunit PxpB [Opitutales bacterium]
MQITPLGDGALILELGERMDEPTHHRVQAALAVLDQAPLPGVTELVPAYTTITVFYDPVKAVAAGAPPADIAGWLGAQVRTRVADAGAGVRVEGRRVEIPVCYGGKFGPDLAEVAQRTGLPAEEVVRRHAAAEYLVYLLGFSPGFAYMGGLPEALVLPRRTVPRTSVPAGSVGIANDQTCIYPQATPGGWSLIGRTPLRLFDPSQDPPTLLRAGDRVRFRAITPEEFAPGEGKP